MRRTRYAPACASSGCPPWAPATGRGCGPWRGTWTHLYMAVPSQAWWEHIHSAREQVRALRTSPSPDDHARLVEEYRSQNGLLASLGMPSRDLQTWLESLPEAEAYREDEEALTELEQSRAAPARHIHARHPAGLGGRGRRRGGARGSLGRSRDRVSRGGGGWRLHLRMAPPAASATTPWPSTPPHGPMRQCEVLRDQLLAAFERDPTLEPRHVLVMTPDIETYGPLLSAVFARRGTALHPKAEATDRRSREMGRTTPLHRGAGSVRRARCRPFQLPWPTSGSPAPTRWPR